MPDQYEEALTHLAYEYAALESAYELCFSQPTTPVLVAACDSFLVHYRSLVEFFHATADWPRRHTDDIRAEDYITAWSTPQMPMWRKWKPSMHILLAHLSTKRNVVHSQKTGFDHRVDFEPMLKEIHTAWNAFAQALTGTTNYGGKLAPLLTERRKNFGTKR